jgi:hypothetical protein
MVFERTVHEEDLALLRTRLGILEDAVTVSLVGAPEQMIFAAGLSTSIQTALSGRGVGLYAVREDIRRVLEGAGFDVVASSQTVGAARHLRSIDLVILDYHMPGITGESVGLSLREAATAVGISPLCGRAMTTRR